VRGLRHLVALFEHVSLDTNAMNGVVIALSDRTGETSDGSELTDDLF